VTVIWQSGLSEESGRGARDQEDWPKSSTASSSIRMRTFGRRRHEFFNDSTGECDYGEVDAGVLGMRANPGSS
jgi:hypothetical protein